MKVHFLDNFQDSVSPTVGERTDGWLVDSEEEEAEEILCGTEVSSDNGVFFEGIWGTGGMIRGRPAKGSVSDNVSKD